MNIVTAEKQVDNYTAEGSVWHDDGTTCNGTAAMFNALAAANISNLTIADATVNVDYNGDYLYVGVLAAFDMGSSLTNVSISDCDIDVTFDEEGLTYRTDLFTAVGGLEAGGWTNYVTACAASGNITLNATNKVAHGGEVYLGGLLGENYAYMNACRTDVALTLNYADEATAEEDSEIVINVGGLSGSGTQIGTCTVEADIDVNAVKEEGASSVNVGGIIGAQRYLTTSGCNRHGGHCDGRLQPGCGERRAQRGRRRRTHRRLLYASDPRLYARCQCGCREQRSERHHQRRSHADRHRGRRLRHSRLLVRRQRRLYRKRRPHRSLQHRRGHRGVRFLYAARFAAAGHHLHHEHARATRRLTLAETQRTSEGVCEKNADSSSRHFSVFVRGGSVCFAEDAVEVTLIFISDRMGDFLDVEGGRPKKPFGGADALFL